MLKKYLICFLVSMVPIVELRGAIPISQGMQLPLLQSYIICVIGNMLPVPVIYLFARRVLEWGADKKYIGKFFTFCIEKGHKGGEKLKQKAGNGLFIALLLFVGIPIPGTGAWTGTLAARGMPTKSMSATNIPLPAFASSFLPPFSPFSRQKEKNLPINFLSEPQTRTFLAKR